MKLGNLLRGLFGKGKPGDDAGVATPALITTLNRASTVQPSWTEDEVALAKHRKARLKRNQRTNRDRARNRKRHPRSAHGL